MEYDHYIILKKNRENEAGKVNKVQSIVHFKEKGQGNWFVKGQRLS